MHCSEPQLVGRAPLGVGPGEMQRAESALWAQLWVLADPGCGHRPFVAATLSQPWLNSALGSELAT